MTLNDRQQRKVLMLSSVASMIDQFNMSNIRLLLEMGYEVHVACNFTKGNTCDQRRVKKLCGTLREMRVRLHPWDCPRTICPGCLRAYRQLLELLARIPFAWMHCHSPVGGALARLAGHRMGVPVVYTAHGFHFYKGAPLKNWLVYYPVEKLLSGWSEVLITVNREDHRFARQHLCAKRVFRIPGIGIEAARFQAAEAADKLRIREAVCRKYQIAQDAVCLLSVGELSRRKNHQVVLQAVAMLQKRGWKAAYLICGQGAWKQKLERQARRLGISKYVTMTGYLEAVEELYQAADIFVFPSLQEGLPVALMEAMAAGLPCAVSDIRGNRELAGRYGKAADVRFSPTDAGGLANILETMIADPKLRRMYGKANQQRIQGYELAVVERRMRRIYDGMQSSVEKQADCHVRVLLAVYNGAAYLRPQLDSILRQQGVTVSVLVRDDGSCDGSMEILQEYARRYQNITVYTGGQKGAAGSFFDLMQHTDLQSRYYAFADQDDVWHPKKLWYAVAMLEKQPLAQPLLYSADVICTSADLKSRWKETCRIRRGTSFGNALLENICRGCTQVFNRELLLLVREHPPGSGRMHDWWMYLTAACFGTVVYDKKAYVLYRQHENNAIGVKRSRSQRWMSRIRHCKQKRHLLTGQAREFQKIYAGLVKEQNAQRLTLLCRIGKTPGSRLRILWDQRLYRQHLLDDLVCRLLLAAGYL